MTSLVLSAPHIHRFVVGDALADIPAVLAALEARSEQYGLSGDQRYALQVCLEEALANVILHGKAPRRGGKHIQVAFRMLGTEAHVSISDTCHPFDATQPPPAMTDPQMVGGRGLKLLQAFSRKLLYRRVGNRNCLDIFV